MAKSRGYRNNNPGNIIQGGFKFIGEVDPRDSRFRTFRDMSWGFRGMFKILQTYIKKHKLDTMRGIISRYAPPIENDTDQYIEFVSLKTGIDPDQVINPGDRSLLVPIVSAMATIENGSPPDMRDVSSGWEKLDTYKVPGIPEDPGSSPSFIKKKPNKIVLISLFIAGILGIIYYAQTKQARI